MTSTASDTPLSTITPRDLRIDLERDGDARCVYLSEYDDLGVLIARGQKGFGDPISHRWEDAGLVVISLGVDGGDHDDIRYELGHALRDNADMLTRAIDSLTECRDALARVKSA
jgi:hypothetical protein